MIWGSEAPSTTAYGSAAALPPVHTDLIVAATGQLSWDGVATGANARDTAIAGCKNSGTGICYCDKQRFEATDTTPGTTDRYSFVTRGDGSDY